MEVTVRLRHATKPDHLAWLCLAVTPWDGERLRARLPVADAVAADPTSFLHPPERLAAKAIGDELMAGLLKARKVFGTGFAVELKRLGGAVGDRADPCRLSGIAYAVAAFLAVGQSLARLDLAADPMGGHGWQLESFAVEG